MLRDNRRFLQAGRSSDLEIAAAPPLPAPDTGAVAREKPFPPYSGGTVQDLHLFPYSPRVPPGRKKSCGPEMQGTCVYWVAAFFASLRIAYRERSVNPAAAGQERGEDGILPEKRKISQTT